MIKIASVHIMTTGCQYLKTQLEIIKKSLQKTFKEFGLEIAAEYLYLYELSGRDTETQCLTLIVWNGLPTDLKLANSLNNFKRKLKDHFFKKLRNME